MRGTVLTEDMHQALRHLICSLGPEWSQDDKFAETFLVVEDELVPGIWTQLQIDKVCLSTYTNTCWNDWLVNYLLCGLPPLDCLTCMTETEIEGCDISRDKVHMLYEVRLHPISPCISQLGVCVLQYVPYVFLGYNAYLGSFNTSQLLFPAV